LINITQLEKEALSFVIKDRKSRSNSYPEDVLNINGVEYMSKESVIDFIKNCEDNLIYQIFIEKYQDSIK
jgi:hypothetical protein